MERESPLKTSDGVPPAREEAGRAGRLHPTVLPFPKDIDRHVAALELTSLGGRIDTLSTEQKRYLASWSEGA